MCEQGFFFLFKFNIGTLNVRGLGNNLKRKTLFNYFRHKELDIIFLQEVHCNNKAARLWQKQWGNKWLVFSGTTASRGTAILFANNKMKIDKTIVDLDGCYVICNITVENVHYTLCNIYAPNKHCPRFFATIFKAIEKIGQEYIIMGRDFNLTLNNDLDRLNSTHNNHRAAKVVNECLDNGLLEDTW